MIYARNGCVSEEQRAMFSYGPGCRQNTVAQLYESDESHLWMRHDARIFTDSKRVTSKCYQPHKAVRNLKMLRLRIIELQQNEVHDHRIVEISLLQMIKPVINNSSMRLR